MRASTSKESLSSQSQQRLERLLSNLHFDNLDARQSSVSEAYSGTYEWVLTANSHRGPFEPHLLDWLLERTGIFWVNGKAGSGKSTLMNFILKHPKTEEALQSWSDGEEVLRPAFFFWRAGSYEQRTIGGLLRSLSWQLLTRRPELIDQVPASLAEPAISGTNDELSNLLQTLLRRIARDSKVCIFIDGLDEFDDALEDKRDLINLVRDISQTPEVKVCTSSRPEAHVVDALDPQDSLRLQDLTQEDLKAYTKGKLGECPSFQIHSRTEPTRVEALIQKVCSYSDGVFLWLSMAVQDLLEGFRWLDSLDMLEKRVEKLPRTLSTFFAEFFNRIDDTNRDQVAKLFQLLNAVREYPKYFGSFSQPPELSVLHMGFLSAQCSPSLQRLTDIEANHTDVSMVDECAKQVEMLLGVITTQCAGLVDVEICAYHGIKPTEDCIACSTHDYPNKERFYTSLDKFVSHFARLKIGVIHRSVLDFVEVDGPVQEFVKANGFQDADLVAALVKARKGVISLLRRDLEGALHEKLPPPPPIMHRCGPMIGIPHPQPMNRHGKLTKPPLMNRICCFGSSSSKSSPPDPEVAQTREAAKKWIVNEMCGEFYWAIQAFGPISGNGELEIQKAMLFGDLYDWSIDTVSYMLQVVESDQVHKWDLRVCSGFLTVDLLRSGSHAFQRLWIDETCGPKGWLICKAIEYNCASGVPEALKRVSPKDQPSAMRWAMVSAVAYLNLSWQSLRSNNRPGMGHLLSKICWTLREGLNVNEQLTRESYGVVHADDFDRHTADTPWTEFLVAITLQVIEHPKSFETEKSLLREALRLFLKNDADRVRKIDLLTLRVNFLAKKPGELTLQRSNTSRFELRVTDTPAWLIEHVLNGTLNAESLRKRAYELARLTWPRKTFLPGAFEHCPEDTEFKVDGEYLEKVIKDSIWHLLTHDWARGFSGHEERCPAVHLNPKFFEYPSEFKRKNTYRARLDREEDIPFYTFHSRP